MPPIREILITAHPDHDESFRWRGDGVSRIEGLSDAVFGFAIALLVAALGVPRTFADLTKMLVSFPAFAATFWMLYTVWSAQYKFFRRYGLEDARTITLNAVLLLFVVFYVYPMMFLYNTFIALWLGPVGAVLHSEPLLRQARDAQGALRQDQWPTVMVVFAIGYVAVFVVFALLHRHALRCASQLELDAREVLETRYAIREHLLNASVGVVSAGVTLLLAYVAHWPPGFAGMIGGFTYGLTGVVQSLHFRSLRIARAAIAQRDVALDASTAS